jgi:two-component system nitrogen regulation response regulator NtrX
LIHENHYREDLYYRLSTVEIHLPALRERKTDIPDLVHHFTKFFCEQNNRYVREVLPSALQLLIQQDWPGNIRQLRATVERLVIFAQGQTITADDVLLAINARNFNQSIQLTTYQAAKTTFQREFITQELIAHNWNISATAEALKINRTNLHKKIQQLSIKRHASEL